MLAGALSALTTAEACRMLNAAGVVCGAVRDLHDAIQYAQATTPERVISVPSPGNRSLRMPALPMTIGDARPRDAALPDLGQHTAEILAELDRQREAMA
jgi:crotonobetainyl-CoA:carnitine CoA-transferase CaiB-like acyl-CoA transferase